MKKEVFNKRAKSARKLQATQKPIRTVSKSKLLVKVLYRNAVAEFLANRSRRFAALAQPAADVEAF